MVSILFICCLGPWTKLLSKPMPGYSSRVWQAKDQSSRHTGWRCRDMTPPHYTVPQCCSSNLVPPIPHTPSCLIISVLCSESSSLMGCYTSSGTLKLKRTPQTKKQTTHKIKWWQKATCAPVAAQRRCRAKRLQWHLPFELRDGEWSLALLYLAG